MSFEWVDVKDRVVEHPRRIELTNIANQQVLGTFDYEKILGIPSELGTAQNKAFLQPIVDALYKLYGDLPSQTANLSPALKVDSLTPNFSDTCTIHVEGDTIVTSGRLVSEMGVQIANVNKNHAPNLDGWENGSIDSSGENAISTTGIRTMGYISVKSSNAITFSVDSAYDALTIAEYDENFDFIQRNVLANSIHTITTQTNTMYVRLVASTIQLYDFELLTPQLEEGSVATAFISHSSSDLVIQTEEPIILGGVPSIKDDFDIDLSKDGEGVLTANTNIGTDGVPYVVKDSDITLASTGSTNVDLYFIQLPLNIKTMVVEIDGITLVVNSDEIAESAHDDVSQIGNYYSIDTRLRYIVAKGTTLQQVQDELRGREIAYELKTPVIRKLKLSQKVQSYADYTQFALDSGIVKDELTSLILSSTFYFANLKDENPLKHKVSIIERVCFEGMDITGLGVKQDDAVYYGGSGWYIDSTVAEENNIDINKIYVTYKVTDEDSNGQATATITCENALAKVVNNLVKSNNVTSEQLDTISAMFGHSIGNLGGANVENIEIATNGVVSWSNTVGLTRTEIYQAEFDLKNYNYEQLNFVDGIVKYDAGTSESQQLNTTPSTSYTVVVVSVYTVGGKEYYSLSNAIEYTSPDFEDFYNSGVQVVPWTDNSAEITFDVSSIEFTDVSSGTYGIYTTNSIDLTDYSVLKFEGLVPNYTGTEAQSQKIRINTAAAGGGIDLLNQNISFDSGTTQILSVDISAINSGHISMETASITNNGLLSVTRIYAE